MSQALIGVMSEKYNLSENFHLATNFSSNIQNAGLWIPYFEKN